VAVSNSILLFFVKAPEPGKVKTRLAKALGKAEAARLYRRLAESIWARICSGRYACWAVFEPAVAEPVVREWLRGADYYLPQTKGSLGTRLATAFSAAFRTGACKVAAIGSDVPEVHAGVVESGFDSLSPGQAVVGPSPDGGFWFIGLPRDEPAVFQDVDWSSSLTFSQIVGNLARSGLAVHFVDSLPDLDEVEDLRLFPDLLRCANDARDGSKLG